MNTRKIDFIDDLRPNGELFAFTNKVKNENNLELCFRGNDNAVNIYYNNQTVWKIYKTNNAGQYKVFVSVHKSLSEPERERICKELAKYKFEAFDKQGKVKRYPYIKGNSAVFTEEFVDETYDLLIPMIDKYFVGDKHKEKKRQQELFSSLTEARDGFYVYDTELQQKGEKKKDQNLSDMVAVRYKSGNPISLALVEVKSTKSGCSGKKSGLEKHIDGMCTYIEKGKMVDKLQEAYDIIKDYGDLKIRKTPQEIDGIRSIQQYEVILILTDEAWNYYENNNNKSRIDKYINTRCTKIKCEIYKWDEKRNLIPLF